MTRQIIGIHVLRMGLASVFLWFGFSQLFDSLQWVGTVPDWAVNFLSLPPAMIIMGNGLLEVILGSFLATGFFVRTVSLILALHLIPMVFEFGFSATGVRDFGLALASFSLSLMYNKEEKVT